MTNDALVRENAELRRQLAERDVIIEQLRAELLAVQKAGGGVEGGAWQVLAQFLQTSVE